VESSKSLKEGRIREKVILSRRNEMKEKEVNLSLSFLVRAAAGREDGKGEERNEFHEYLI